MPYVDIRVHFSEETDDDDTYYNLSGIEPLHSTLPKEALYGIGESLSQSDFLYAEFPAGFVDALEGKTVKF